MPYLVEPAKSGRSTCKVSKEVIEKGELRFGSFTEISGHGSYHWRKLKCITNKQVANVESKLGGFAGVGGFDVLSSSEQTKFRKAFEAAKKSGELKAKAKAKAVAAKAKMKAKHAAARMKAKEAKVKAKGKSADKATVKTAVTPKTLVASPCGCVGAGKSFSGGVGVVHTSRLTRPNSLEQHHFLDFAKSGEWDDVRKLLDVSPHLINVQPAGRWSALHQAAVQGDAEVVTMLLDRRADLGAQTKDGKTPVEVARLSVAHLFSGGERAQKRCKRHV